MPPTHAPEALALHSVAPTVARWRPHAARHALAALARPFIWAVNRPSMSWFGEALHDVALRCNGIAINYEGRRGLGAAEEALLARLAPGWRAGDVLLDVGANVGSYARELDRLAPPGVGIRALEPHPRTFATLRQRLEGTRVEALNLALGDTSGRLDLHDFAEGDGSTQASLSREAVALYGGSQVSHPVMVETLDGFLAARGIARIALLKVDTEGFDLNVLRGAREAIGARRLAAIQFEFIAANIATGVRMRDFYEVLEGYRIHRLCLNGALLPLDYSPKRCEIYISQNLVALPHGI